jgi:hypothetical protein
VLPRGQAVVLHRTVVGDHFQVSGQAPGLQVPADRKLGLEDQGQVPGDAVVDAGPFLEFENGFLDISSFERHCGLDR